ncbi:Methyltransferase domain-containing protein [Shimia gijangensis]|uniref:Methyltransferase domain-containing protein n=1 Tax=Shimia gijangensis TaxID=1470563 RepID=A0A1M6TWL4_9RHOB|nr:class I SAM-dependent methyltransferase [Shimia gijangensis]SHK61347.1 Methyltransferase domain-containing protein [Shimia gijangensis]
MNDVTGNSFVSAEWYVEECACPMCGRAESEATRYEQIPFKIKRCSSCALWFLSPRLAEEDAQQFYHSDAYFAGGHGESGYEDYSVQERSLRATFRKFLKTIDAKAATGGAFLEVGCGPGYLLDEANSYFESLAGVELSDKAAKQAASLTGARIYNDIEEIDDVPAFDCIVATHVIEHIYEPVAFVETLARRLKPGGSIILAAPHMGSLYRRIMGRRWPSFKYPEHVSFFDQKTLPDLFRRAGLEVTGNVPYPHVFPLSLVLSKFGIKGPLWTDGVDVTLPATTISFQAKKRVNI